MDLENLKEQWKELEYWKQIGIVLTFGVLIAYIIYIMFVQPKLEEKNKLISEINGLKNDIVFFKKRADKEKINILTKKISEMEEVIKNKNSYLKVLEDLIPIKADIDNLLIFISNTVNNSGLYMNEFKVKDGKDIFLFYDKKIKEIKFIPANNEKSNLSGKEIKLKQLIIQISTVGTLKSLLRFLNKISSAKRNIKINDLSIDKKKSFLSININLSTYYMEAL